MTDPSTQAAAPPASFLERIGAFFFARRNALFSLVLIALLGGFRPTRHLDSVRLDRWLDLLGFAIALAGQALRVAVIGYAYVRRGGKDGKVYADRLVTEGFFNHSRNPLYLGNLLVLTGLFIIHNNPWVYLLGLPFFLFAYSAIVVTEEAYLKRRFGSEYEEYCRRVPRWLPRLRSLRRSIAGMRFNWEQVVVKEYSSTFSWVATALALLAYEALVRPSFPGRDRYFSTLAGLFALAAALWAWARYFKKTDRLRAARQTARSRST